MKKIVCCLLMMLSLGGMPLGGPTQTFAQDKNLSRDNPFRNMTEEEIIAYVFEQVAELEAAARPFLNKLEEVGKLKIPFNNTGYLALKSAFPKYIACVEEDIRNRSLNKTSASWGGPKQTSLSWRWTDVFSVFLRMTQINYNIMLFIDDRRELAIKDDIWRNNPTMSEDEVNHVANEIDDARAESFSRWDLKHWDIKARRWWELEREYDERLRQRNAWQTGPGRGDPTPDPFRLPPTDGFRGSGGGGGGSREEVTWWPGGAPCYHVDPATGRRIYFKC